MLGNWGDDVNIHKRDFNLRITLEIMLHKCSNSHVYPHSPLKNHFQAHNSVWTVSIPGFKFLYRGKCYILNTEADLDLFFFFTLWYIQKHLILYFWWKTLQWKKSELHVKIDYCTLETKEKLQVLTELYLVVPNHRINREESEPNTHEKINIWPCSKMHDKRKGKLNPITTNCMTKKKNKK